MKYPEDFKNRVKELYPERSDILRAVDYGQTTVGQLLYDETPKGVAFEEVLNATSLEDLKESAKTQKAKFDLYQEWCKLNNANRCRIFKS